MAQRSSITFLPFWFTHLNNPVSGVSKEAAILRKKYCLLCSLPCFKISSRCSAVIESVVFLDLVRILHDKVVFKLLEYFKLILLMGDVSVFDGLWNQTLYICSRLAFWSCVFCVAWILILLWFRTPFASCGSSRLILVIAIVSNCNVVYGSLWEVAQARYMFCVLLKLFFLCSVYFKLFCNLFRDFEVEELSFMFEVETDYVVLVK